ncbi:hypothetical protein LDENG_00239470 [Lucifuga dentata]|nr:hypothetical protein LDENG_00239470 [Lucifuga dentata]
MRRVRRRGGNKEKVFGCDLLEHLAASAQEIPQVLRSCSEFVEHHGIVDGIYRLSGVSSNIQKLRNEFENDGNADLNKDVYLQDIHCISSLCKAYFRELPNPLLTYQLYDKFAEAVAIQLEEERLVKIREVLKELPRPHYRTLEFLMTHLVKMASHSSETNMHARNLAIVWAPNLLRSKDIEASGFNGTAAFMEVRVQSIVVEFILTHVPQLFPEQGASLERRKSLPSPSVISNQEEGLFRSAPSQPVSSFGNISPGDGPLPMRPYHAIIESTDKRKGSLKGRKWMSIFNIGGRFHDPRRRNKHSAKEKDRPPLRPARSMDSLSIQDYPNEGSRLPHQRPPSTTMSPLAIPSPQSGTESGLSTSAVGGSGYAVTYRRGTGIGGVGIQGSYNALDPEGFGTAGNDVQPGHQSRSPGLSSKAGRRAAMHITGPTMVTVPLHITSNLALGVLQGGGGDRVIHCGRDKDRGNRVEGKEGAERVERKESRVMERKEEDGEDKNDRGNVEDRGGVVDAKESTGGETEENEGVKEEKTEEEAVKEDCVLKPEQVMEGQGEGREQSAKCVSTEEDTGGNAEDEYIDMKGMEHVMSVCEACSVLDDSDVLNSTKMDEDDQELSGYVQENFDFLDHMDCSISSQMNEFSVEPPSHADDEYEIMEPLQSFYHPGEPHLPLSPQTHLQPEPQTDTHIQTQLNPHRLLTTDSHKRHTNSLSLPYDALPLLAAQGFSEEEVAEDGADDDDDDDDEYSYEDDDNMFIKSLPPDFFYHNLTWSGPDTDAGGSLIGRQELCPKSSEGRKYEPLQTDFSADQDTIKDKEDEEGLERKKTVTVQDEKDKADQEGDQNNMQSSTTEEDLHTSHASGVEDTQSGKEKPLTSEASRLFCVEVPLPWPEENDKTSSIGSMKVEDEREVVDNLYSDDKKPLGDETSFHVFIRGPAFPEVSCTEQREIADVSAEVSKTCISEDKGEESNEGEESKADEERKCMHEGRREQGTQTETAGKIVLEITESDEGMCEESIEIESEKSHEEKMKEGDEVQDNAISGTSCEIWDELEDVICEVIEDVENKHAEKTGERESFAEERDRTGDVVKVREEEEQMAIEMADVLSKETKISEEEMVELEEGVTTETEIEMEVVEEPMETLLTEEKHKRPEMQEVIETKESNLLKGSELEDANEEGEKEIQEKRAIEDENNSKEQELEKNDKERAKDKHQTPPSIAEKEKQLKEVGSYVKKSNEGSDHSQGCGMGVGRKVVISKKKVYQVKAVPVIPPKPQYCKLTALSLRQQQQQREKRDVAEQGKDGEEEEESRGKKEKEKEMVRGGERERRRDGDEAAMTRSSPISMCFDEAVAIATMRREREKESERDRERQRDWGYEIQ